MRRDHRREANGQTRRREVEGARVRRRHGRRPATVRRRVERVFPCRVSGQCMSRVQPADAMTSSGACGNCSRCQRRASSPMVSAWRTGIASSPTNDEQDGSRIGPSAWASIPPSGFGRSSTTRPASTSTRSSRVGIRRSPYSEIVRSPVSASTASPTATPSAARADSPCSGPKSLTIGTPASSNATRERLLRAAKGSLTVDRRRIPKSESHRRC